MHETLLPAGVPHLSIVSPVYRAEECLTELHRPEEIPKLYAKAREGYDVVFARRRNRTDPWFKVLPGRCFYALLAWLTGQPFDSTVANFSISSRMAIRAFRAHRERDRPFPMVMRQFGFERTTLDVTHAPRFAGTTSYSLRTLLAFALQNVIAASTRPLVMSVQFGLAIAAGSLLYGTYVLVRTLRDQAEAPGWATLALLMSFLFGLLFVQLVRMELSLPLTDRLPATAEPGDVVVWPAGPDDLPEIGALAAKSHRDTRFFKDDRFPAARAADLCRVWLERDIARHVAPVCETPTQPARPRGYVTCGCPSARASRRRIRSG